MVETIGTDETTTGKRNQRKGEKKKMEERLYEAKADNGHDYLYFQFYSTHRAGSKANHEDARREYKRLHGYAPKILETYRTNEEFTI